jgi:hypothetical protein
MKMKSRNKEERNQLRSGLRWKRKMKEKKKVAPSRIAMSMTNDGTMRDFSLIATTTIRGRWRRDRKGKNGRELRSEPG